jgi:hypothetical protein
MTTQRERALALAVKCVMEWRFDEDDRWQERAADLIEAALREAQGEAWNMGYSAGKAAQVRAQNIHDEKMAEKYERQNNT